MCIRDRINTGGVSLNSQSAAPYGMKILTEGTADLSYSLYADGEVHIKAGNMQTHYKENNVVFSNTTAEANNLIMNTVVLDTGVNMTIEETLVVNKDVSMNSDLDISGNLMVNQSSTFNGDVSMNSDLTLSGTGNFLGNVIISEDVSMLSNVEIVDNLVVRGKSTLLGDIILSDNDTLQTITVAGTIQENAPVVQSTSSLILAPNDSNTVFLHSDITSLNTGSNTTIYKNDISGTKTDAFIDDDGILNFGNRGLLINDINIDDKSYAKFQILTANEREKGAAIINATLIGDAIMSERRPISFTHNNNDSTMNARIFSSTENQLDISASTIAIHNDNIHVEGSLEVERDVSLNASLDVSENLTVRGDFIFRGGNLGDNAVMENLTVNNKIEASKIEINGSLVLNGGLDVSFSDVELYGGLTVFGNTNMWNIADSESTTQASDINNLRVKNIYSLGGNEFFTDFDPETAATLPDITTLRAAIDPSVNNVFAGSTLFLKDTIIGGSIEKISTTRDPGTSIQFLNDIDVSGDITDGHGNTLSSKQDTLIAGDGIEISGNTLIVEPIILDSSNIVVATDASGLLTSTSITTTELETLVVDVSNVQGTIDSLELLSLRIKDSDNFTVNGYDVSYSSGISIFGLTRQQVQDEIIIKPIIITAGDGIDISDNGTISISDPFTTNNGNVGIGTDLPSYALDVSGTINCTQILVNGQAI